MKQKPFISIIIILLVLLTAIIFFRDSGQVRSEMKSYNEAGTYTVKETYKNAEITAAGVTIENATFTGNVSITDAIVDGEIHLTSCDVNGELFVYGGDTIYLNNGTYQKVTVDKQGVKIILLGDATIDTLDAKSPCTIVASEQSKITNLIVEKTASRTSITSQDSGTISTIQANGIADIILNTPTKSVTFGPDATGSTLVANAAVEKIQTESKVMLTINANVGSLIITGAGGGTTVTLGNNATIASLGTDALVEITGSGSVTSATTNNASNLTGTITPGIINITTAPLNNDPTGGLTISAKTSTTSTTGTSSASKTSGTSNTSNTAASLTNNTAWYAESGNSSSLINPKYDTPAVNTPADSDSVSVTSVQVLPVEADVFMGSTLTLSADIRPENATNKTVSWESANPKIATVSNGIITPVSNGEVMIVARTQDGDKTDFCKVTVKTNITAVTMIDTIDAVNNNISEAIAYNENYTLPVSVTVRGYGSNDTFSCSVTWTPESADNKKVGETTYVGTLIMPGGYYNFDNIQPKIQLTVKSQPVIAVSSALTSQRIYLNGNPASLSVDATVTEGKTLSYQWFQRIGTVDTTLDGETGSAYDPDQSTTPGTVYYYCILTAENADPVTRLAGIVVTSTNPANPAALAEMPKITSQPVNVSGTTAGSPVSLSVEANVDNGGTLTYQWFTRTEAINADGTAIPGATGKTHSFNAPDTAGTTYYYVEITNTDAGRSSTTTVSLPVSVTVIS
ncbi:Ig-like domain-containing protein [Acetobacterium tundrae]|uniref:BIG2 domain-containing protein n=1 Tax=Acetobacterium tundrae TaxID=132932 RepID=A0ABR6WNI3_9FIRM|nr:Ig-like domain-containing protein [Acetobacterium tundrae]MBC3797856.1 hypothetical protein [Acetobacterium tundrae]